MPHEPKMGAFENRVAVITGGASGIGLAMATAFAERGARIVLADINEVALAREKASFAARGTDILTVRTDVRDRASVDALAETTWRKAGGAHIVCNNAGIAPFGSVVGADLHEWKLTMDINFWGIVHGIDAFVPRMIEQNEGGHIVNTASMAGLTGMLGLGVYCASKFAVVGLTESLHRELKGQGIGVSVLCPMIVDTNIGANSMRTLGKQAPPTEGLPTVGGVIGVEEVANRVVRGIEKNDLYILTHPEQREILRRRSARLDAVFDSI
jgi:NAD(P)-dependent dehydrogenase (short-subunit alcohol dehydrogenase family)